MIYIPNDDDWKALLSELARVYSDPVGARQLLRTVAGFPIDEVFFQQAPKKVWGEILEAARGARRLDALLERVASSQSAAIVHPKIEQVRTDAQLRDGLARVYDITQAFDLLERAGLRADAEGSLSDLALEPSPPYFWDRVVRWLDRTQRTTELLDVLEQDERASSLSATVQERRSDVPVRHNATPAIRLVGDRANDERLERLMGARETFFDVSFFRRALEVVPAIVRLDVALEDGRTAKGTGFMVRADRILTNHHVLHDEKGAVASRVTVTFDYERGLDGRIRSGEVFEFELDGRIQADEELDAALVAFDGPLPEHVQTLRLSERNATEGAWVSIIQHPHGRPKQVGLTQNIVRYVDENITQYLVDTENGSSGSPVFNERWEVVALHHSWGDLLNSRASVPRWVNQGTSVTALRPWLEVCGVMSS